MVQELPSFNLIYQMTRVKRWAFTINNPTTDEIQHIKDLDQHADVTFIIAELENAETGTEHIQGYIEFKNRLRPNQAKNLISKRAHVEIAQADRNKNIQYCSKTNRLLIQTAQTEPTSQSNSNHSASRSDDFWLTMYKYIQTGPTHEEFAEQYPKFYLTSPKIDRLLAEQAGRTTTTFNGNLQEKNYWIYGPPGIGKSKWANSQAPPHSTLHKAINKWWDGYRHHDHQLVIIEDWPAEPTHMEQYIKWWADRFPFTAEIKGGSLVIEPAKWHLIITSNHSISEAFKHCTEADVNAIKRRFTEWNIETPEDIRLQTKLL
jgi:hypothetical protein